MEKQVAITIFESLSSGLRLDAYRLLVRQGTSGMVAGDIAAALDIAPSNLSFHLKALTQAGLLSVTQEGRYQRYRANLLVMLDLIAYLTEECCAAQPQLCANMRKAASGTETPLPVPTSASETSKP